MIILLNKPARLFVAAFVLSSLSGLVLAAGMVPETSVVLINAGEGEGSINVTNTDDEAVLLYSALENLPEDPEDLLLITSPIARVEAGEKQLVRFIFQSNKPLVTQRLKRVIFEGIPQKDPKAPPKIKMIMRQNLPVIISPGDLPPKDDAWTLLKWSINGNILTVKNDSRYVVRLNQQLQVMPGDIQLTLPRTYVLPGQSESLELPTGQITGKESKVRFYPASLYGYQGISYDAPLSLTRTAPTRPAVAL